MVYNQKLIRFRLVVEQYPERLVVMPRHSRQKAFIQACNSVHATPPATTWKTELVLWRGVENQQWLISSTVRRSLLLLCDDLGLYSRKKMLRQSSNKGFLFLAFLSVIYFFENVIYLWKSGWNMPNGIWWVVLMVQACSERRMVHWSQMHQQNKIKNKNC